MFRFYKKTGWLITYEHGESPTTLVEKEKTHVVRVILVTSIKDEK
jgi:hypothetical protein